MLDPEVLAPTLVRPFRRAEYDQMVSLGFFVDERIELLHGHLVGMTPQDPKHMSCVGSLAERLLPALIGRAHTRIQGPFAATDDSEPEPDLAVVPLGDYRDHHPSTAYLVIEVANSSLRKDRELKPAVYAAANVSEYWVVDVRAQKVERFTKPIAGSYTVREMFDRTAVLTPIHFPEVAVVLDEIF